MKTTITKELAAVLSAAGVAVAIGIRAREAPSMLEDSTLLASNCAQQQLAPEESEHMFYSHGILLNTAREGMYQDERLLKQYSRG